MTKYTLTYFDINGGRAEPIRLALHIGGIEFEDRRISFEEFMKMRSTTPFNAIPVLEIDGAQITQSNALCRYIGKKTGLYPENDLQALYCDEVLGVLEDLTHYIVRTMGLPEEELKPAREKLIDGWISIILKGLEKLLARRGGQYFADNQLTIADLRAFTQMRSLSSGNLDYIPTDIVQQLAPGLFDHHKRIGEDPRVRAYYAART